MRPPFPRPAGREPPLFLPGCAGQAGQQLCQGQAAEVLGQAEVHGRGLVQLGYRRGHVMAGADLEEAG
jgi:hypothetical protein